MHQAGARLRAKRAYGATAFALALAIFALDVLSPLPGAVAVLYTVAVVLASRSEDRSVILGVGLTSLVLALVAYGISHGGEAIGAPAVRLTVSVAALGITTLLCVRNHRAAEERNRSEERYRTIFNAAGLPIWEGDWSAAHTILANGEVLDDETVERAARVAIIRDANDAAARLFGLQDRRSLIGETIVRHHTPAARATLGRILTALSRGDTSIEEETRFLTASGDIVDVVLRVTVPAGSDDWSRVLAMALDVTDRNRAQARLMQAQTELTHVSRVTTLGQLAASIGHEVNQPLSAIITYAKSGKRWLVREAPDAMEVADCLDHIATNGARAANVIASIRDLVRKQDPKWDAIDLVPLIEETVMLLRRDLQSHDVVIRVDLADHLPAVRGDRVQLQQVLMNLMLNAEQAMAETEDGQRELCVDAMPEHDGVVVQVRDCGTGIPGDPESIFAPFFTTKESGLGMGLSICRSIVEQHGGTLSASNNPDRGATFRIHLAAAEQEEAAA